MKQVQRKEGVIEMSTTVASAMLHFDFVLTRRRPSEINGATETFVTQDTRCIHNVFAITAHGNKSAI
jgi:hypothetical protein